MAIGCRIRKNIVRPPKGLIERFRPLPVANIDDTVGRIFAMNHRITPVNRFTRLVGPAFTVKVPEGDNLMLHKAMDLAQPGDVLVIDAGADPCRAIFGEIIVQYCRKRGIAGIIVDGALRDLDAIGAMTDFPVYAIGACPNGPWKNGPGEINFPITCGGVIVNPGDIIVGDADGVIAISQEDAEARAAATEAVNAKEEQWMAAIREKGVFERPWVDEKLSALKVEYV